MNNVLVILLAKNTNICYDWRTYKNIELIAWVYDKNIKDNIIGFVPIDELTDGDVLWHITADNELHLFKIKDNLSLKRKVLSVEYIIIKSTDQLARTGIHVTFPVFHLIDLDKTKRINGKFKFVNCGNNYCWVISQQVN
jgi:hypothetical protein